jgi:hypothetical protein
MLRIDSDYTNKVGVGVSPCLNINSSTSHSCYRISVRWPKFWTERNREADRRSLLYCPSNLFLSVIFVPFICVSYDTKSDHVMINILCILYAS